MYSRCVHIHMVMYMYKAPKNAHLRYNIVCIYSRIPLTYTFKQTETKGK